MSADLTLPHDDFAVGIRVGWEAVCGDGVPLSRVLPMPPRLTMMGYRRFTLGVYAGVEATTGSRILTTSARSHSAAEQGKSL